MRLAPASGNPVRPAFTAAVVTAPRAAVARVAAALVAGALVAAVSGGAACASRGPAGTAGPAPAPAGRRAPVATVVRAAVPPANPALPPVPALHGPLRIRVVYPRPGHLITARDSNFIFGSVGDGGAGLRIDGALVPVWPDGAFLGWLPVPPADSSFYDLVAYTARDTVRLRYPVRTLAALRRSGALRAAPPLEPVAPVTVMLYDDSLARSVTDTDAAIIARPTPRGTYRWFLFPGTAVQLTGYRGDRARVRLDAGREVWVDRRDLRPVAVPTRPPAPVAPGAATVRPARGWVDLVIPVSRAPAYRVEEEPNDTALRLTLYDAPRDPSVRDPSVRDPLVRAIERGGDSLRTVYRVALARPLFGYLVLYRHGTLTLRIRRPPAVSAGAPLRGRTIVIDPGHPPIGATGPTGLWEPVATLAVGERVRDLLVARGARVVMTRTGPGPVPLGLRPIVARRADADALVSIHLNADGDGQDPFRDNGTGTYYFHEHSRPLARAVQRALVPRLGLRDRGVIWQNLALCRPTWFPAVLAEGLFVIMPDQEAAIRTPQYQMAYARGIVDGLARYFDTLAQ